MRLAVVALVAMSNVAMADGDGITVRVPERWEQDSGPQLHLDYVTRDATEGPASTHERKTTIYELGPLARVVAQGDWWSSMSGPDLTGAHDLEVTARGWRAGLELSHDFGWFRLGVNVAMGHVDSPLERGDYRMIGISLFRTFRLSRWMQAWISLTAGYQQWLGTPPPGQQSAGTIMLGFGTTFR